MTGRARMKRTTRLHLLCLALMLAGVTVAASWGIVSIRALGYLPANGPWLIAVLLLAASVAVALLEIRVSHAEAEAAARAVG